MLKKRIIPCLDIKDGRTVKGINFLNLRDAGNPVHLAKLYADEGADELVFLDITATIERRATLIKLVSEVADAINIPFTVGGGIRSVDDASAVLDAGADKVSINTAAIKDPTLITTLAKRFGSQAVVLAIDTNMEEEVWKVFMNGGRLTTGLRTVDWAKEVKERGAGEILLTSMSSDGVQEGFSLNITSAVCDAVNIPVIASGGAGSLEDFYEVFSKTNAAAALAASVFHFGEIQIPALKQYLHNHKIPMRL
ncbi:MAG: imidazole glycerol phosphate synthase subunit HisF [Ferruginibacter sp.]